MRRDATIAPGALTSIRMRSVARAAQAAGALWLLGFAADVEVTGHPIAELELASGATDGTLFVYLEDVAPDGRARIVTEGMFRAGHRIRVALAGADPDNFTMLPGPAPLLRVYRAGGRASRLVLPVVSR